MTSRFGKWPKYLGNGLDAWGTAYVFEKRLNYLGNGLRIWQVAKICGKWRIYLGIGLSVLRNGQNMWEMT